MLDEFINFVAKDHYPSAKTMEDVREKIVSKPQFGAAETYESVSIIFDRAFAFYDKIKCF